MSAQLSVLVLVAAIAVAGCGKNVGDRGGSCGAFKATVDGQPIEALTHGYGTKDHSGYTIEVSTRDTITCEGMLTSMAAVRPLAEGEQSVRVIAGGDQGAGIGYGADTWMHNGIVGSVKITPEKAGDPIAICIKGQIKLQRGASTGKTFAVEGEVTGTYCGEIK